MGVYHNTVKYPVPDARYADETWRSMHHFKEVHQHDAPLRRSRDFKPVPWGTARGMPNYRHSEPWLNMKNLFTLKDEHHHHPTKWIKIPIRRLYRVPCWPGVVLCGTNQWFRGTEA